MILDCESEFSRIRSFPIEYVLEIPVHETDSDRYADSESGPVLYVGSSAQVVYVYVPCAAYLNTVLVDGVDVGWSWMAAGERVFTWALHLPCRSFSLSFIV